jgi:hypothetical protein
MTMLLDPPSIPVAATRTLPRVRAFPAVGIPPVMTRPVAARTVAARPVAARTVAARTVAARPVAAPPVITLPVTTVRQAVRVALDRTRRMTLLGSVPVLRRLALPWLLPLHLLIVALTADHIRHTPEASLSYSDGTTPRVHPTSLATALLLGTGWLGMLWGTVVALMSWHLGTPAAVVAAVALVVPVVEVLGLLEFAVRNRRGWRRGRSGRKRSAGRRARSGPA